MAITPAGAAQEPALIVSTSIGDQLVNGDVVSDEDVVRHASGGASHICLPGETLTALLGLESGGLFEVPGDVDALHDPGESLPGGGLLFSLVADYGAFLDGDVLRVVDGAAARVWAEQDLVTAMGAADGNIDIDALQLEDDGTFLLSLAEDEASSLLSGDTPGVVSDGAVLRWDPVQGSVSLVYTESEMAALVSQALGQSTSPGDVKGLARHPADGSLLFTVQSPSAHDGSVFRDLNGGELLAGHTEADFGFTGSGELDALSVARSSWPALTTDQARPQPGDVLRLTVREAQPGSAWLLLMSGGVAPAWVPLPGWGGLALEPDMAFGLSGTLAPFLQVTADGLGVAEWVFAIPVTVMPADLVVQAFDLAAGHVSSNPVLLEVAQ